MKMNDVYIGGKLCIQAFLRVKRKDGGEVARRSRWREKCYTVPKFSQLFG